MNVVRTLFVAVAGVVALVLAIPAALLVLPFWGVRKVTAFVAEARAPQTEEGDPFIQYDERVGWTPRPNLDTHATDLNQDIFQIRTDSSGWRGRRTVEEADVVVFGDSFAFGFAVDDAEFFADLDPDFAVKAIGAPGYNMVQSLMWLRSMAERLKGKTVVWLVYGPNDFEDNIRPSMLEYRTPFLKETEDGAWVLETSHLSDKPWPFPSRKRHYENYVEICSDTDLTRRVFSACRYLLEEARDLCASLSARLIVCTVPELSPLALKQMEKARAGATSPDSLDPDLPDQRLAQVCQELGIAFVPLARSLTSADYLENDVHWNAEGHRKVNRILKELWQQDGGLGDSDVPFDSPSPAAVAGG